MREIKPAVCLNAIVGFTLVELLIAISIFSIIILSLYSAFQSGVLSYNKIDSAFNIYQTVRVVFNRMELDLKNSFPYSKTDSKFTGSMQTLGFVSAVDSFKKYELSSQILGVRYELNNGILKRTCYQGLGAVEENLESEGEELSSDVKEISFEYACATDKPENPYSWQESWPKGENSEQKKFLPLAVKIKLSLIEKDKRQKEINIIEFSKIVSLPLGSDLPVPP